MIFLWPLVALTMVLSQTIVGFGNTPDFEAMKTDVNTQWSDMVKQLFTQGNKLNMMYLQRPLNDSGLVSSIVIPKCVNTTFDPPIVVNNTQFVTFIQFVNESTEEYITYSEICNRTLPDVGRPLSGVIVFNTYMLDKYFDYNTSFYNEQISKLICRELNNMMAFSFWYLTQNISNPDPAVYPATGIKLLDTSIVSAQFKTNKLCELTQLPIVMYKRGLGFSIPQYISPQDIMGELLGHEGVQMQYTLISQILLTGIGWYSNNSLPTFQLNLHIQMPCDFYQQGCNSSLNSTQKKNFYCNQSENRCSVDNEALGYCQPTPRLPECYIALPNLKNNRPVLCNNSTPACALFFPNNQTNQVAQCFNAFNFKVYVSDGVQCPTPYNFNNIVGCTGFQSSYLSLDNHFFIQRRIPFGNCSNRGTFFGQCICQDGYFGAQCEFKCFDEKCVICTDSWSASSTPSCYYCAWGYTVLAQKFCKLNVSSTLPRGCSQSFNSSADSCVDCISGYSLIPGPIIKDIGSCGMNIFNCKNKSTDYKNPNTCVACDDGYIKQYYNETDADYCFETIAACKVYEVVAKVDSCKVCLDDYVLTIGYPKRCLKVINNCSEYTADGLCSKCIENFTTLGDFCVKTIANCKNYTERGLCVNCTEGFTNSEDNLTCYCAADSHLWDNDTQCAKNVNNCSEYSLKDATLCQKCQPNYDLLESDTMYCLPVIDQCVQRKASNTTLCNICNSTYYPSQIIPKCFKNISNCTTESEGLCSVCQEPLMVNSDNKSCVCEAGKHLSVDRALCFQDIDKCLKYDTIQGVNCTQCDTNYQLHQATQTICVVVIDKCDTRIPETPNLCDTCLTGFHPAPGNATCNPNIIGCTVFNGSMCAQCDSTYWLLQDYDCFWNITGCVSQKHQTCLKCANTFIQSGASNVSCEPCPEKNLAISNKCYSIIEGCVTYAHKNNTCLVCEQDMYLDFSNNKCLPPIDGCLVRRPTNPEQCLVCQDRFQLINGLCSACRIKGCENCIVDQNTEETLCQNCINPLVLGTANDSCLTNCELQYGQTNCTNCLSTTKCLACTSESFFYGGVCKSCEQSFAYCTACSSTGCSQCKEGSYLNTNTKYCQLCTNLDSNCLFCNSKQCIQCQTGFMLINGQCVSCDSQIKGSLLCARPNRMKVAYFCLDGFYFTGDYEAPCTKCSELTLNCQSCSSSECYTCEAGYYLKDLKCLKCQETCATCNNTQVCLTCPSGSVLNNQQICSQSIVGFSLKTVPPVNEANTYVQKKQSILTKQAPYPVIGKIDKNGYFCAKDEQCNNNGRCQITNCECFDSFFGSRCQYSVNSTSLIRSHQSDVLTYLTQLSKITSIDDFSQRVSILNTIADTSQLMQSNSIDQVSNLLQDYLTFSQSTSNVTTLTTLLTCVGSYFEGFVNNLNCPIQIISQVEQMQYQLMNQLQLTKVNTPHLRQFNAQYDLQDPDQAKNFKNNVKAYRLLQDDLCDNVQRIIEPTISVGQDTYQKIIDAQTDPHKKIDLLLAHIYQKTHVNQHSNSTLYAATTRVEFSIQGEPIQISNVEPIQIIIPKVDQRDSTIDKDYQCVSWNEQTESWSDNGILVNLTQHCQNYIVCYSTHLSDFTVVYQPQVQSGNPEFDSYAVQTNAAWWLSLSWFILFVLLSLYNYGKYSFLKIPATRREVQPAIETEKADNQVLVQNNPEQQNEVQTPRYVVQTQRIVEWTAFPLYSILCSDENSSASIQIQKICLLTIQLQMFTFITAGFISIDPFMKEVFIVYYFATIVITWISNYLFGVIAVNTRSTNQVSPAFFTIWFLVFFGLSVVGIYFLWDLDGSHDGYLVLGVCIYWILFLVVEIIGDCLILDFLVAVLCNNALKLSNKGGILDLVRNRGYLSN